MLARTNRLVHLPFERAVAVSNGREEPGPRESDLGERGLVLPSRLMALRSDRP
jgi:hypothetical protein